MLRAGLLLLLTLALTSSPASAHVVNVSLAPWELNFATAIIRPIIVEALQNFTIPGVSEKHFSFSNIVLRDFNIQNITVSFDPPAIKLSMTDLTVYIPPTGFEVMDKVLFVNVHCHGHLTANITDMSLTIGVDPTKDASSKFFLAGASTVTSFGSLSISHKFDHTLCKIADKIIEDLIGNVDKKIREAILNDLPAVISKAVTTDGNAALAKGNYTIVWGPFLTASAFSFAIDE
jgi:hypothetical protein